MKSKFLMILLFVIPNANFHALPVLAAKTTDDLLALAIYCREHVNPALFNYSFSVAILHRKDTKNLGLPSLVTIFPDKFFSSKIIAKAKEHASLFPDGKRVRNIFAMSLIQNLLI